MSESKEHVLVEHETDLIPYPNHLEPRGVRERQILKVQRFRFSAAATQIAGDEGDQVSCPLSLTLLGIPVDESSCEAGVLFFVDEGESLQPPRYDPATRRLLIEFPVSRQAAIEATLRRSEQVYLRYQEDHAGQMWADLYTKFQNVGQG